MAYAILRTQKYKTHNTISGLMKHLLRTPGGKLDNVDLTRSHLNVTSGAHDSKSFFKAVKGRIDTCTRKPRPDANKVVEVLLTASPEFFEGKSYDEQKAYLSDCLDFAKQFFGEANVIGAYMHFDEKTPHISVMAVPIETSVRKTKTQEREVTTLNASHYLGGAAQMVQLQTDFAEFVQARGHDLLRGEPKAETNREHEPLGSHWREQVKAIDAAADAAFDHLDDAATQSKVAADLLAVALNEAQRTGFEAQTLTVQRGALDAEQLALAELRAAMQRQGAALDQEWGKLRVKAGEFETRSQRLEVSETFVAKKQQALDIRYKTAADQAASTGQELARIRELRASLQARELELATRLRDVSQRQLQLAKDDGDLRQRQRDILRAEQVAMLVTTPELVGMLEFLAERKDARDLISLLKADPAMASMVRQQIEVGVGLSGADLRAPWTQPYEAVDWEAVQRAGADAASNDGPAGP